MKRSLPLTFALLLLFFIPSFAQQPGGRPTLTNDIKVTAPSKTEPSKPATNNQYPPLPADLRDAEFENADGTVSTLADYKGKIVIVNLWGIWCGPCRNEMPHLQNLFDTYESRGLEVLGVNGGDYNGNAEPITRIHGFASQMNITYPLSRASTPFIIGIYRLTGQQAIPQTVLIDTEGHLRALFVGGGRNVYDAMKLEVKKLMADSGLGNGNTAGQGSGTGYGQGKGVGYGSGSGQSADNKLESPGIAQPVKILSKPKAAYTGAARDAKVEGVVTLRVTFLSSGEIGAVSVVKGLPHGLTEQAIAVAKRITFEAAKSKDGPVTVTKLVEFSFAL